MPTDTPQRVSRFEPLGGLQLIRINPADACFFTILILLWVELGYRSFWPGYLPEPTTVSTVCAAIRLLLSIATNLGINIVKNMELGHDISIFHRVTVPPNDCESFGLTVIFAIVFFSLRRFINQGIIFLVTPAFDYYMCLGMHLLVAVMDELMFPLSYVERLKEHRHQAILDAISKAQAQVAPPPPTPLPSLIRSLTSRTTIPEFQPTLLFSSGTSPTTAKEKRNAVTRRNRSSLKDPQSSGLRSSTTSSPRPRIDESPLNREELELYTLVAGKHSASTIQSYPQWRVLFRLDIPLHLNELEARQKEAIAQNALRATIKQSSTISKTPSVLDAISNSVKEETTPAPTPAPAPPLKASDEGKGRAATSSLEKPGSLAMDPNPVVVSSAPTVLPGLPKSTPPAVTTPARAPPHAPTPPLKAPNKGKGKATNSNLSIPSKTVANESTPSTSAPKVSPRFSTSTLPMGSSPPAPSSSVPASAPIPQVAPPHPNPTTPAVFSPAPPVTPRHQFPDYAVDADGDCIMVDVFEEPWRSVQLSLGPVAPVEAVSEMEIVPTPTEPELMEMTPTVSRDESYQASMDVEPVQVYSVVCPQDAGTVVPGVPFEEIEGDMSPEEIYDFLESILRIGEAPAAEHAHEAPVATSEIQAEVSLHLPTAEQVQEAAPGANMDEAMGLAPPPMNVQPATLLPYAIPTDIPFVLATSRPTSPTPVYRYRSVPPAVIIEKDIILANMSHPVPTSNPKCFATSSGRDCPPCALRDGRPCCGNLHGTRPRIVDTSDASNLHATKKAPTVDPSTDREQALDKGKGKAVFIPSEPVGSNSSPSTSSAPTVPSTPPKSTTPVATPSVATPQAPASPPTALNKGKGKAATSNLYIPRKPVANKPTPSTSAPKVPSPLSISTLPSPPVPSSSF